MQTVQVARPVRIELVAEAAILDEHMAGQPHFLQLRDNALLQICLDGLFVLLRVLHVKRLVQPLHILRFLLRARQLRVECQRRRDAAVLDFRIPEAKVVLVLSRIVKHLLSPPLRI